MSEPSNQALSAQRRARREALERALAAKRPLTLRELELLEEAWDDEIRRARELRLLPHPGEREEGKA